jgi:hypothetical protein
MREMHISNQLPVKPQTPLEAIAFPLKWQFLKTAMMMTYSVRVPEAAPDRKKYVVD